MLRLEKDQYEGKTQRNYHLKAGRLKLIMIYSATNVSSIDFHEDLYLIKQCLEGCVYG
jgi:hypothetical protein